MQSVVVFRLDIFVLMVGKFLHPIFDRNAIFIFRVQYDQEFVIHCSLDQLQTIMSGFIFVEMRANLRQYPDFNPIQTGCHDLRHLQYLISSLALARFVKK